MRRNIYIGACLLALIITLGLIFKFKQVNQNINVQVSPAAAVLKLDGSALIHVGVQHISAGKHTISASFDGFNDTSVSFDAPTSGTKEIDVVLSPNSQSGFDYLLSHPDEQALREKVGGNTFHNTVQQHTNDNPIVKLLPYVGPGNSYRIDYGSAQGDASNFTVYVTYYVPEGKQAALNWLSQNGYAIDSPSISYRDMTNQAPTVNNPHAN